MKLHPEEIRVGNFLKWTDDSHDIVEVLGIYKGQQEFIREDYFIHYKETSREEYGNALLDEFTEVPLNDKWFHKLGYGKEEEGRYSDRWAFNFIIRKKGEVSVYSFSEETGKIWWLATVRGVHELQNITDSLERNFKRRPRNSKT